MAVSESPLSLPSGKSCNSADMHSGSSTDVRDVDFCDGILFRDRTLMPDCERGICGEAPPSDDPSTSPRDLRALLCASFNRLQIAQFRIRIRIGIQRNEDVLTEKLTCNNPMHHERAG